MANISCYAEKAMLDWVLGGAAVTQPGTHFVGLATVVPSSTAGSEIAAGTGYTRQAASFSAAQSPAGSAVNQLAMTFGPFSGALTLSGITVWDTQLGANSGNLLWYGTLASARALGAGDSFVVPAGSLLITLA